MTDRLKGCVVVFDTDIREDDAKAILDAITMIKGVSAVASSVANSGDWMNRERIRQELVAKLYEALK